MPDAQFDLDKFMETLDAEDDQGTSKPDDSNPVRQVREAYDKVKKESRELAKEVKALREFKTGIETKERESFLVETAKSLGLSEKQASLYSGEPDPEAMRQWAVDHDLAVAEPASGSEDAGAPKTPEGFTPGTPGGSDPGTSSKVSRTEWLAKVRSNPAEAKKIFDEGRVDLSEIDF